MKRSALITASLLLLAAPAGAQERAEIPQCAPWQTMVGLLKSTFNEIEFEGGWVNDQALTHLFASPGGDTWTLVVHQATGNTCIILRGTYWFANRIPAIGERPA